MARVLIGWEFGANRGHAVRMIEHAAALRAEGHEVVFAMQRIDALSADEAAGSPVWQAPVSPRLLVSAGRQRLGPVTGMADIIARLGMDDAQLVVSMVRGWEHLVGAIRPDVVIAEFAPYMLMAARGRVPAIAIGNGFTLPPSGMDSFPALGEPGGVDQVRLLGIVNRGLAGAGQPAIAALPRVFAAEREIATAFAELDPYAGQRRGTMARPIPADFDAVVGSGDEIFVYAPETIDPEAHLWDGLGQAGLPVRVHVPRIRPELSGRLERLGLRIEAEPLPFRRIAERSRLLLSHGGHGFLSSGLAAGLPSIVFHYDLEKLTYGLALAKAGLGGHVSLGAIVPRSFAESLKRVYGDDALVARARAAGADFRSRDMPALEPTIAQGVAELA
ncbi:MAG: glycosyltransferase [Allosphingosinicella sp.]